MNDLSKRIMGQQGIEPSENCLNIFKITFPEAINTDWSLRENHYEAVFYKENIEYIAEFSLDGDLIQYKMFLPPDFLPLPIRNKLARKGELMNAVLINNGHSIVYECIMRDKELNRFLIYISNLGKILEERNL